ncbi:hypothetical protein EHO60_01300 [Leptospira fletcheri]|uniref:Lipoprotein n=1 Tax=Leptospira fletcheri TaxID=2484981 RepID=A0A4R9GJV4_9LEPT|nr:hypothetical protein [Leptospira fletcheri]TGK14008.1 hypothetical protein EHO60_01300 [Leptospira fletcheri]
MNTIWKSKSVRACILLLLGFLGTCSNLDDLYGTGKNKKHNKDNCNAATGIYLACLNANAGAYASSNCNSQYLLVLGACSSGSGSGGGGGGY